MKKRISQKELKILWKQLRKGEQKGRVIMVIDVDCSISLIIQSSNYEIYSESPLKLWDSHVLETSLNFSNWVEV